MSLLDIRSGVQIAASEGSSTATNLGATFAGLGVGGSGLGGGALSGFTRTPQGQATVAAFVDAYNKLVVAPATTPRNPSAAAPAPAACCGSNRGPPPNPSLPPSTPPPCRRGFVRERLRCSPLLAPAAAPSPASRLRAPAPARRRPRRCRPGVRGGPALRVPAHRLRLLPPGGREPPRRTAAGPGRLSRRDPRRTARRAQAGDPAPPTARPRRTSRAWPAPRATRASPPATSRAPPMPASLGAVPARPDARPSGADRARSLTQVRRRPGRGGRSRRPPRHAVPRRRGGVGRDPAEAARWFTVAAENGVPEAQYNLGLMHYRGEGVPRQLHDALRWMRQRRRAATCRRSARWANSTSPASTPWARI